MRILFVGMADSVHTARWINQVSEQGWELHLFSATSGPPHPDLRNVTVYNISFVRPDKLHRSVRVRGLWPTRVGVERLRERIPYPALLARLVSWLKPDIVHSMEIQRAGYLTLEAKSRFKGRFPTWVVANWGSDIYLFGRLAEHAEKIKAVMASCDFYNCECHRDVGLARDFGFRGEVLPVLPVAGGYDVAGMQRLRAPGPTSARRLVAVKGYQNWAGRALVALRAIGLCANLLKGYRVAVYLASPEVRLAAELLSQETGIPVEFVGGPREEVLRMHGRARVSVGLSISDAISTSLLETIIMGSFPVQSNTGCGNEWLQQGKTGLFVHPEDAEGVAAAIRRALTEDELVDAAAEGNLRMASERLEYSAIQPRVVEMYRRVGAAARP